MEWFIDRLGLGDGELEFVDVGVPEILSVKWSSFGGDDANTCAPTGKIFMPVILCHTKHA